MGNRKLVVLMFENLWGCWDLRMMIWTRITVPNAGQNMINGEGSVKLVRKNDLARA